MARKTPKPARRTAAKVTRQQPETLRLASISPSLTVRDIEKSLAWYRDILGFHVGERWEDSGKLQSVELHAGTVWLIINQDDFAKGRDRVLGEGVRFYANTRQDVDRVAADIRERGGDLAMEPRDRPWGTRELLVIDPDGYKIAITTMG